MNWSVAERCVVAVSFSDVALTWSHITASTLETCVCFLSSRSEDVVTKLRQPTCESIVLYGRAHVLTCNLRSHWNQRRPIELSRDCGSFLLLRDARTRELSRDRESFLLTRDALSRVLCIMMKSHGDCCARNERRQSPSTDDTF